MSEPTAMNRFLVAIVDDEVRDVNRLLRADAGLATRRIETERLYDAGIFHWIYTGDTALHLAAAGYRADIIQNSAEESQRSPREHRDHRELHSLRVFLRFTQEVVGFFALGLFRPVTL